MEAIITTIESNHDSASMSGHVEVTLQIHFENVKTPADIDRAIQSLQRQRMVLVAIQEGC